MKKTLKFLFTQLLCLSFLLTITVNAQAAGSLKTTVDISIMPEYDTSDVLVLNSINFVNSSSQPYSGEMRFPVPKGTTNNIVKETSNPGDSHMAVQVEDKGDYAELVWKPAQPIQPNANYPIHLEYYYNPLPGTGSKSFNFTFKPSYAVDRANIQIYQPLKSTDLRTEPATQLLGNDKQGFKVFGTNYTGIQPNQGINLKVSYNKTDPNPSLKPQTPQGGGAAPRSTVQGQFGSKAVLIPLIVLAVLAAIIIKKATDKGEIQEIERAREEEVKVHRKSASKSNSKQSKLAQEKKKLRRMLMNGEIGEATYHELLADLEEEYS